MHPDAFMNQRAMQSFRHAVIEPPPLPLAGELRLAGDTLPQSTRISSDVPQDGPQHHVIVSHIHHTRMPRSNAAPMISREQTHLIIVHVFPCILQAVLPWCGTLA